MIPQIFQEKETNLDVIDARPTKELFISMLVRDLKLEDAISDLVDNCVDGAKTLKPDKKYKGLWVNIEAYQDRFVIEDNCGGFSTDIARNHAFRFGRDPKSDKTPNSIGQFGIGMKRALFKIGNHFIVESVASNSKFTLEVPVQEWKVRNEWDFKFKEFEDNIPQIPIKDRKTRIVITELNEDVATQFSLNNFIKELRNELSLDHMYNIHNGLEIRLNGKPIESLEVGFTKLEGLKHAEWTHRYEILNQGFVDVRVLAGISTDSPDECGWYILCNDRMILGKEQSELSGWGRGTAKYHLQYNRFRGYVFFYAENSSLLPWNTTKNGMNLDSPIFRDVREHMIIMMKQVFTFLNKLKEERDNQEKGAKDDGVVVSQLKSSPVVTLSKLTGEFISAKFEYPTIKPASIKTEPDTVQIKYWISKAKANKAKASLNVTSLEQVGLETFNYYYGSEIE